MQMRCVLTKKHLPFKFSIPYKRFAGLKLITVLNYKYPQCVTEIYARCHYGVTAGYHPLIMKGYFVIQD